MNIAIIPARSGSKRIPNKNIKDFLGKPIISYSITAAIKSNLFDKVVVSTDSDEIKDISIFYGAEVPFLRRPELSNDNVPTAPVIEDILKWYKTQKIKIDYACCIYATAPLIRSKYIKNGFDVLKKHNCTTVFSVTTFPFPIYRGLKVSNDGTLSMIWPEHELTRSQDLPEFYHDAGQFYWMNCKLFLNNPKLYSKDSRPVIIPRYFAQDIDTAEDWLRAESMFKTLKSEYGEDY